MDIKAIVLDMDGTLLTAEKKILPKTKQKLIELQNRGIKVILASGRPQSGMLRYAEQLELTKHDGFIISSNGSKVTDIQTNEVLYNRPLSQELVKSITEHAKDYDVHVIIADNEYAYVTDVFNTDITYKNQPFNILKHEIRANNLLVHEVINYENLDFEVNKILLAGTPAYLEQVAEEIAKPFTQKANAMFTADFFFEFTAHNIDKAAALDSVATKYGLKRENIMAFGDGHNDKTLLEYSAYPIAMGNAVDDLKAIAYDVTDTNEEEGIYKALVKYLD